MLIKNDVEHYMLLMILIIQLQILAHGQIPGSTPQPPPQLISPHSHIQMICPLGQIFKGVQHPE